MYKRIKCVVWHKMSYIIVFLLVLLSSLVSVAYEIDGITIRTCDTKSCRNLLSNTKFTLNCDGCDGSFYVSLTYEDNFYINCDDDDGIIYSKTYRFTVQNEVHLCEDNLLVKLLMLSPFVEVSTLAIGSVCDDEIKENEIKLIAATLFCSYEQGDSINCSFMYGTESCNVTSELLTTTTTNVDDHVKSVLIPILILLLVGVVVTVLIVISVVVWFKLRSKQSKSDPNIILHPPVPYACSPLQLTTQQSNTNTSYANHNAEDATYAVIMEDRTRSNSKDIQDKYSDSPTSDEFVISLIEGEVADSKLYQELPCMKNQSVYYSEVTPLSNTGPTNPFIEPTGSLTELDSVFKSRLFEITAREIEFGEMFASGQFGVVYTGIYKTENGDIPVAVKQLKESADNDTLLSFMREAATMSQFSHPNVLRLLGVITSPQPWMIVTELLKTELRELLVKLRESPSIEHVQRELLMKFSVEIADGMEYLAMRKFVHRDLAARNVLVAKDFTVRIADFGLSRRVGSENDYYTSSGGMLPLRWTVPEAVLYQKFSEKSDVWSYGMTLYEIWSLGERPWGDATNQEIIDALSLGKSISPPRGCPEVVGRVMMETWKHDKQDRPTFTQVREMLSTPSM